MGSVFNLSKKNLSAVEESVLALGLNHIPVPRFSRSRITNSLLDSFFQLERKIKWGLFFMERSGAPDYTIPKITDNKSLPLPYQLCNGNYIDIDEQMLWINYFQQTRNKIKSIFQNHKISFSKLDLKILSILKPLYTNREIIIKPADKNLGIVILNCDDYRTMCLKHLSDKSFYHCVPHFDNLFQYVYDKLDSFLPRRHPAAKSMKQLMGSSRVRIAPFYCLPKLHKSGPVEGRPIISAINSVTYHASQ